MKHRVVIFDDPPWLDKNIPVQLSRKSNGTYELVTYSPKRRVCNKQTCFVHHNDMPKLCRDAAERLRRLADLFEQKANGAGGDIKGLDSVLEENNE